MTGSSLDIRNLTTSDVDEAGDLLARAFVDYPMWSWIIPDARRRREALPSLMRMSVRWGLLLDNVFGNGEPLRGVAIWAPPGMADAHLEHDHEATDVLGADVEARMDRFGAEQRVLRDRDVGPRTWYLPWLGVDPAHQRTGAGTALLRDMFTRLDAAGDDTYLETEIAANVPYYHQHGFAVLTEGVISGGGPAFWTMRRTPPLPASAT